MRFLAFLICCFVMSSAWAEHLLNMGVLAFRPKAQTTEQWQPLADYLQQKLHHPIQLTPYGYAEFNDAVAKKQVDIIITNPSHYVFLRDRFQISAPIASITSQERGYPQKNFGGVIFTRADNTSIEGLEDLKEKKIAAVSKDSLGGFQTQAYELYKAKLNQPKPKNLLLTGMPHDKTLQAVLEGHADVGFIRSGVLESMEAEGSLDLKQIKILNAQKNPKFPYLLSTGLYPEWPVAVLPRMDDRDQKAIALALLSLTDSDFASKSMGVHGFTLPEDYSTVETLLRSLRLPPYETLPRVTLQDLWQQYAAILLGSITLLMLIFGAGLGYFLQNHNIIKIQRTLLENEARFMDFFYQNKSVMLLINGATKTIVDANQSALAFYGYSLKQITQMGIHEINTATQDELANNFKQALNNQENFFEFTHRLASNTLKNVEVYTSPVTINGQTLLLSIVHDVTEKTLLEKQLKLYASVFTHAKEGILITDADINIIDVNDTFSQITGYCRKEVIGHNPKILSSGLQPKAFYAKLWQSLKHQGYWTGEIWNRKKMATTMRNF